LKLGMTPPAEVRPSGQEQSSELARLAQSPQVMHRIRLKNRLKDPFTTAPALIFRASQIIAQGTMFYTPVGADSDLTLTAAADVLCCRMDREVRRIPGAAQWNHDAYEQVDLAGEIRVMNHKGATIELEVTQTVLGSMDTAAGGTLQKLNALAEAGMFGETMSNWWTNYDWPGWWSRFNGVGQARWRTTLAPGKAFEARYTWHYFRR
jgi:hypothetical protein